MFYIVMNKGSPRDYKGSADDNFDGTLPFTNRRWEGFHQYEPIGNSVSVGIVSLGMQN